jgi:hypothetical protein
MIPLPFNGAMFVHDLVLALDRAEKYSPRGRPHYDERRWWHCLQEADERDTARELTTRYAARDAKEHFAPRTVWHERLYACCCPKMNGRPLKLTNRYRTGISKKVGVKSKNCP